MPETRTSLEQLTTHEKRQVRCFIKHGDQACNDCNAGRRLYFGVKEAKSKADIEARREQTKRAAFAKLSTGTRPLVAEQPVVVKREYGLPL